MCCHFPPDWRTDNNQYYNNVNSFNLGIDICGLRISVLLYADDFMLLGESEKIYKKCLIMYIIELKDS